MKKIIYIIILITSLINIVNARNWDEPSFTENELIIKNNIEEDAVDEVCKRIVDIGCSSCFGYLSKPDIDICVNNSLNNNFWRFYFDNKKNNEDIEELMRYLYDRTVEYCAINYAFNNIKECFK